MTKKERVKSINRFRSPSFVSKKFLTVFSVHFLILVLLFAFCIPLQYVHAIGSPSFWSTSPTITEDFTTAPDGRILSMTNTQAGGTANGEYYFHYNN